MVKKKAPAISFGKHPGKIEKRKREEISPGPGQYVKEVIIRPKNGLDFGKSRRDVLKKLESDIVGPGRYLMPSDFKKVGKINAGFGHGKLEWEKKNIEITPSPLDYQIKGEFERSVRIISSGQE